MTGGRVIFAEDKTRWAALSEPYLLFSPLHQRTLPAHFFPMSALSEASTPAQEAASASIDTQQLHHLHNGDPSQQQQAGQNGSSASGNDGGRKCKYPFLANRRHGLNLRVAKAPSVRRACSACHTGKTRCSEVLPCQVCHRRWPHKLDNRRSDPPVQSCLKRGLGQTCAYPDPEAQDHTSHHTPGMSPYLLSSP